MPLIDIIRNPVFIACHRLLPVLAQVLKMPLEYMQHEGVELVTRLFSTGGMPSSHSAVVTAAAVGVGHYMGFDTPIFGLAFALASVVIYDATNVRRQAGFHAHQINRIIKEVFEGKTTAIEEYNELKEVLGHSPLEALGGIILGILVSIGTWLIWP